MSFAGVPYYYYFLFLLYGLYAAATEGVSKAWISNITDKEQVATAIGTYAALQSICALVASTLAGLLWYGFGAAVAFTVTGLAAIVVAIYLSGMRYSAHK